MVDSQQWVYKHPRNLGVPQASRKTWHDAKRESAFKVLPTLLPQSIYKNGGKVHVITPTQQEDKFSKTTTHNTHISEVHKPSFQDVGAVTPQLADPVYQVIPAGPGSLPASDSTIPTSSSESTESSESDSSEEAGGSVRAVKPPLNFRYVPRRQRRQIPTSTSPPHSPVFLSIFPASRLCSAPVNISL
ncbi:hypothetical protein G5714_022050 [Onychostoma macrolepis]|uniref:Uncharacterized protein n=1 Tax=Onychostoma macrolepis TaxID=369639 RepID=A0A7J6BWL1_9TELE|nr:hypothetical protein G5714_022050 [Onychostoma macrolepis]